MTDQAASTGDYLGPPIPREKDFMSWYYMPQSQELDANGRRQWDTHIHPSDGRPSIPRSTQLEEWIVGARIFLGQLGSFARLAVLGNQGLPRDSPRWTPILVAAVFAHMRMDASFPSPGWIHLVPQTYWSRTNQQTRANDIKNRLDAAWDEWAQVCEEKEAGSDPLIAIMRLDKKDYHMDNWGERGLWHDLTNQYLQADVIVTNTS